jgi:hypothetical protein
MISIGQHLEREEIFYSGAEADARALLNEIKQALTIPAVVGRSEQLVLFADWLQYNGKWQLPEEQVKSFLKEQKQN